MKSPEIHHFDTFVMRTPLLPVSSFFEATRLPTEDLKALLKNLFTSIRLQEAVYLASPSLSAQLTKWQAGTLKGPNEQRFLISLMKYFSRMSSRCTPFGLFAGVSALKPGKEDDVLLEEVETFHRNTSLDMHFMITLTQRLSVAVSIEWNLALFPNTTLYPTGEQFRYIERSSENNSTKHRLTEVERDEYLDRVIEFAKTGQKASDIINTLVDSEITYEEAREYIQELINSQVLISEIETSVSGPHGMVQLTEYLSRHQQNTPLSDHLNSIRLQLQSLDSGEPNLPEAYERIIDQAGRLSPAHSGRDLIQTDLFMPVTRGELSEHSLKQTRRGVICLMKLTSQKNMSQPHLSKFIEDFRERYDQEEVPLAIALDNDIGVGYKGVSGDFHPLLADMVIGRGQAETQKIPLSKTRRLLHSKIRQMKQGQQSIEITEADLQNFEFNMDRIPDTFSAVIEVVYENSAKLLKIEAAGSSSAACLIARFSESEDVQKLVREIVEVEVTINHKQAITAEIVHIPEARAGNVLVRPAFRKYEIPYLSQSLVPSEQQLAVPDLMVSLNERDEVILRSKKLQRTIKPYLSNAHNYQAQSTPIYHFLCDLQSQNVQTSINFSWQGLDREFDFLPRVVYEGVVLSTARWVIDVSKEVWFQNPSSEDDILLREAARWKQAHALPPYILYVEGDNKLLINLQNALSVRCLLSAAKKKAAITLSEFLFGEQEPGMVKRADEKFTHQIIISYQNQKKLNDAGSL